MYPDPAIEMQSFQQLVLKPHVLIPKSKNNTSTHGFFVSVVCVFVENGVILILILYNVYNAHADILCHSRPCRQVPVQGSKVSAMSGRRNVMRQGPQVILSFGLRYPYPYATTKCMLEFANSQMI